ncbi:MAG: universal stress protein [Phycisphaerae bacterium]|nr:universal stress protein [Phycisphaerae bacterium]
MSENNRFQKILVPLDGSRLAECALPLAAAIARRAGGAVMLLHVLEASPPDAVHGQRHLRTAAEAAEYLQAVAQAHRGGGLEVEWHVHEPPQSDTAAGLGGHAEEFVSDLVVMCMHGRARLRDWLVGNLAQQLARRQRTPILLVPARKGQPPPATIRRCLAPLDGEPGHLRGLGVAAAFASLMSADVLLATVVNPRHRARKALAANALLPGTMQSIAEFRQEQAVAFLQEQASALAARGVPTAAVMIIGGDPAHGLARLARQRHADLVALTTHGRSGTNAFWSRSLPPRLLSRLSTMFLLVPAEEQSEYV